MKRYGNTAKMKSKQTGNICYVIKSLFNCIRLHSPWANMTSKILTVLKLLARVIHRENYWILLTNSHERILSTSLISSCSISIILHKIRRIFSDLESHQINAFLRISKLPPNSSNLHVLYQTNKNRTGIMMPHLKDRWSLPQQRSFMPNQQSKIKRSVAFRGNVLYFLVPS